MNNIFVVNIMRFFKYVLIYGNDISYDAMKFITTLSMTSIRCKHLGFEQILWIIINDRGVTSKDLYGEKREKKR